MTNAATGAAVVGAKVYGWYKYNLFNRANGAYSLNIYPAAYNVNVTAIKAGFDLFTAGPFTFTPPATQTLNIGLMESTNAPVNVVADPECSPDGCRPDLGTACGQL